MEYGTPSEEMAQEFAMFMKGAMRNLIHGAASMDRTVPQVIAEVIMTVLKLPISIIYAMMTYNETLASAFKFIYVMFMWYVTVTAIVFLFFLLENVYKSFFAARLAVLGRLRPWGIVTSLLGIRDTNQNDLHTELAARNNNFSVNVVKVPTTGLMLQVAVAFVVDIFIGAIVSLAWPITGSVFIITTLVSCRSPRIFYEYTMVEASNTHSGSIQEAVEREQQRHEEYRSTNGVNTSTDLYEDETMVDARCDDYEETPLRHNAEAGKDALGGKQAEETEIKNLDSCAEDKEDS
jgi:hypothetical protein